MSNLPWFVTVDLGDLIGCSLSIAVVSAAVLAALYDTLVDLWRERRKRRS